MNIQISGIDTSNSDVVNEYVNVTLELYPQFQQLQINTIDASTLQIVLS